MPHPKATGAAAGRRNVTVTKWGRAADGCDQGEHSNCPPVQGLSEPGSVSPNLSGSPGSAIESRPVELRRPEVSPS